MFRRPIAFLLVLSLVLFFCGQAVAGIYGTANGTYDFSNGDTGANGGIGADNSASPGFATFSDKFVLSNGMLIDDLVPTSIWTGNQMTANTTGTFTVKAEGGTTCKSFTFKDLGIHVYDIGGFATVNNITVITKDQSGTTIATHSGNPNLTTNGNTVSQLSTLINSGSQFNDNNVASVTITWTFLSGDAPSNLNFDNITIADVSASSPATVINLNGDSITFTEGDSAQLLDSGGNATANEDVSWTNGKLLASFTSGQDFVADLLGIVNQGTGVGQIGLNGSYVTYGGTTIGTVGGGHGNLPLTVTFNANATNAAVTALLRNLTFLTTNSSSPSITSRIVRVTLTNSAGYVSANNDITVAVTAVNDAPTFTAGSGSVVTTTANGEEMGYATAVQPDGKILVAGNVANLVNPATWEYDEPYLLLARYNADGSLDTSFATNGFAKMNIWTALNSAETGIAIAVLPDGKIVVGAGDPSQSNSEPQFGMARFNADGSPDTSFGTNGAASFTVGTENMATAHGMTMDSRGNILLVGESQWRSGSVYQYTTVLRVKQDGTLDTSFGTGGIATTNVGGTTDYNYASGIAVQSDGKIVVVGTRAGAYLLTVLRYNDDGTLDTSFGTSGIAQFDVASSYDGGTAVAIQSDGKIVVGGNGNNGTNSDFMALRLTGTGALDTSFNGTGKVILDLGGDDRISNVTIQSDGKILLGGLSSSAPAFARLNGDGTLDTSFDSDGKLVVTGGETGQGAVLQGDGRIVTVGAHLDATYTYSDLAVDRLNADGSKDLSFGSDVTNTLNATASYTQGDTPVVLDDHTTVFDTELSSVSSYSGATLTLARNGGANANDLFSASGTLAALTEGGNLTVDGTIIGTVTTNSAGTLLLTFTANATETLVNSAMRQIAYSNSIGSPASVQIDWTFSDGNTGSQGTGGAKSATGSVTVTVISLITPPTVTTAAASAISATGATLNGTVNANNDSTTVTFEYGLTTGYGSSATASQSPVTGSTDTAVSAAISGLSCNTLYHFRAKGVSAGGTTNGLDTTFTTSACTAQTIGAISFSPDTIIISGTTTVGATATSGLTVGFSSLTPSVCTVSGTTVTAVIAGVCTIAADQAGDAIYSAATRVTKNITVAPVANAVHLTHSGTTTDYTTIQAAADASVDGDLITVDAGTFVEQVHITRAITLQGAGSADTIIQSPDNASLIAASPTTINNKNRMAIMDLQTATPGTGTITVRNLGIDGRYQGNTQAQDPAYNSWLIGIAAYDTNAVIDTVDIQHVAAPLDGGGNYEGLGEHMGIVAEGGSALAAPVTVTIQNSTIGTFQKSGIIAWGPKLNAVITANHISGVGILGRSGQSGIQIGSAGARAGTTATISGNTIDLLGAPDDLVATGWGATGILSVTAGPITAANNSIILDPGASANSLTGVDVGYSSDVATLHDNTLNGMTVGIQVDSPLVSAIHQISNNTLTTVGGNPVVFHYDPLNNGDTGGETIDNFGTGYAVRVVGENFSSGTLTTGDGSTVAANSVQATITGGTTILYIDTTTANGSATAPLTVTLNGAYVLGNFALSGEYIRFTKVPQTITFDTTAPASAVVGGAGYTPTATGGDSGNPVVLTIDSASTGVCTISGGTVTFLGVGTCTIDANQAGSSNYSAATQATQSFAIDKGSQAIIFGTAPTVAVAATGTVSTTGGASTSPVVLSSTTTSVCTISGATVTGVTTGTCTIAANQAGDANYNAAPQVTQDITIGKGIATVSLGNLSATYDSTPKSVTATTTPVGLTVNITYNGSATAPTTAGSYTVVATVSDANYTGSATDTLVIAKAAATVSLGNLSATYDGTAKAATATTAPAGLTVTITYDGSATAPTDAGSYTVVAAINDSNYSGTATGTLAIAKAGQTITFDPLTAKTYGDADFGPGATVDTSLPITYASDTPAVATITAGGLINITGAGSAVITATQAGDTNHLPATVQQTLTVNKALITVTADNKSRDYAAPDPTFTATYTGFVNGENTAVISGAPTFTTDADAASPVGSYTITPDIAALTAANYTFTAVNGTLAVGIASQTIVFNPLTAMTYGAGQFNLSATGGASGNPVTFTSSDPAVATVSGTTVTIIGAGTTTITASQAGTPNMYASATAQQTLTVNKAHITLTADNKQRTYNTPNPPFTGVYSGFVNSEDASVISGTPTYTTTATQTSPTGSYPITPVTSGLTATNYDFVAADGTLAIDVASQTITFDPITAMTYGAAPFDLAATGGGSGNPVTFTSSNPAVATISGATVTIVGAGSTTITASQAGTTNYASATAQQGLTVNKATLTVTAQAASRVYNSVEPSFSATYSGFVNGDNQSVIQGAPNLSTTAILTSPVGSYPITPAIGNLAADNYLFSFVNGTLTITQATPAITWVNPSAITYGTALDAAQLNATSGVAGSFVYTPPAGSVLNAGAGQTLAVTFTPADTTNYAGATANVAIDVNKATATVTLGNLAQTFDGTARAATITTTPANLPVVVTYNGTGTVPVAVGSYAVLATVNDANYQGNANGTLVVAKATPAITWANPAAITYGTALDATQLNATTGVAGTLVYNPAAGTIPGAGTQTLGVTFTPADTANYGTATASVTLDVAKAPQSITFAALPTKQIGDGPFTIGATATSGLPVAFASSNPAVATVSGTTVTIVGVGTATITASQPGDANRAAATSVAQALTVAFNGAAPQLTVSALSDGATTTETTQNVSGTVFDLNGISSVTVNGTSVAINPDGSFSFPVQLVAGANTITVIATSNSGATTSDVRTINMDSTAPYLKVDYPPDNKVIIQNNVTVTGTISELLTTGKAVAKTVAATGQAVLVTYTVNGSTPQTATLTDTIYTFTVNLDQGMNTIQVMAINSEGKTSQAKRTLSYMPAFSLAVTDPASDVRTVLDSYLLTGTVADNTTPVTVTVTMDGQSYSPAVVGGTFQQQLTLSDAKIYQVSVTGTDQNSNSLTVQRNIIKTVPKAVSGSTEPFTIVDALLALKMSVGIITPQTDQVLRLDVAPLHNGVAVGDGKIDIEDALVILRMAVGLL